MHSVTGHARTSCYAYVARDPDQRRAVSVGFLRMLLRTPHGEPFHNAFMHGNVAPWWVDQQQQLRDAELARAFVNSFTNVTQRA